LRVKCGCIAAALSVSATPTTYTQVGQSIAYTYTVYNVGTADICYPINICDDKLGGWVIPCSYIPPGCTQSFTRTYTVVAADITAGSITNSAFALIEVECDKCVCTPQASTTVTYATVPPTL
jgi:hypothetical protein